MVRIEVGVELATSTRLVGKELERRAQMVLDQTVVGVVVVLLARSDTNIKHVDDHGSCVGMVAVFAEIALIVGSDGTFVGWRLRGRNFSGGSDGIVGATRSTVVTHCGLASVGVGTLDLGQFDCLENACASVIESVVWPQKALNTAIAKVTKGAGPKDKTGQKEGGTEKNGVASHRRCYGEDR